MQIDYEFRNLELSPMAVARLKRRMNAAARQITGQGFQVKSVLAFQEGDYVAHCSVCCEGETVQAEYASGDLGRSIDKMVDKLAIKLRRRKLRDQSHQLITACGDGGHTVLRRRRLVPVGPS